MTDAKLRDSCMIPSSVTPSPKKVTTAVDEALAWLEEQGAEASTEDLTERKKSLEKIVNPVMESVYKRGGGGSAGGKEEDVDTEDL